MKKIISILLAAAMVLAFAACGNNSGNNGGNDAAVTDPLEVLSKTWSSLPEEDKFPAAGGDNGSPVDDKPGKFDISDTDNLDYMLSFPAGSVDLIDSAASLTHMMNMNTFTCGAYHVKNAADAKTLAQSLRDSIQSRQWMCGFPDKLVVITICCFQASRFSTTFCRSRCCAIFWRRAGQKMPFCSSFPLCSMRGASRNMSYSWSYPFCRAISLGGW